MTKIYCDICGKECDDTTKFIVPIIVDSEVKGGIGDVVVWKGRMKGKTEMNMCEDCQNMIGSFIYELKDESKNKEN